ncbi:MAG: hypothetical protein BLM47_06055 [Candidatus Reconcilbacillus cellulovorans]|uniref:HAMP domain-containing protein n=1 Tax=Candidatus Reconcilbacillus cellulovorans TaxID=1906605 RepID=A0A2A6E0W8_9BACL|nr:MAG: hypothetical protein BLM47_06055 [Candidatus Reconcilbacillus cellulovorans]
MRAVAARIDAMRGNTFFRIVLIILMLLAPLLALYTISYRVSTDVLKQEVRSLKMKDLSFLAQDINTNLENIATLAVLLSDDLEIQNLRHLDLIPNAYERNEEQLRVIERLRLLNVAGRWDTHYAIYVPDTNIVVSTTGKVTYNMKELAETFTPVWETRRVRVLDYMEERMVRHFVKPETKSRDLARASLIVEASFPKDALVKHLDDLKRGGQGDPFLFRPTGEWLANRTADRARIERIVRDELMPNPAPVARDAVVRLDGTQYLITVVPVPALGWQLVDYVPLEEMMRPIVRSRNLFYASVALLLALSVVAGHWLYRNVQRPIAALIRGVQRLRAGDYSTRIRETPRNEFAFLFLKFNQMAEEIEELIGKVYAEQLRTREANLKWLQSQINPHFLYNCFALIRSLTRLGKTDSVLRLTTHLGKYYRYTTRIERQIVTLGEELELIKSYLEIQNMHIPSLSYRIDVPEPMRALEIPRLLLQPIVENAVVHGIEPSGRDGTVRIAGEQTGGLNIVTVEDDGVGMSAERLRALRAELEHPSGDDAGCALRNIRERLVLQFGEEARLEFDSRENGGTTVRVVWPNRKEA